MPCDKYPMKTPQLHFESFFVTGYGIVCGKEFYMTRLEWVEELTESVWNVCIKFDTWKKIENFTVL